MYRVARVRSYAHTSSQDDAWLIIENKVYDVTDVLSWHPGGASAILAYAGKATVAATLQVSSQQLTSPYVTDVDVPVIVQGYT